MREDQARLVISEREVYGEGNLSVATGMAIDSSLGRLEAANDPVPPVTTVDLLLINVGTLYRNLLGSIKTELRPKLTPFVLAETLANEMRVIETLVSEVSEGRCEVEFYQCTYDDVMGAFSKSLPRVPTTPGQKLSTALEHSTLKTLQNEITVKPPIHYWKRKFPEYGNRCLLLSHYAVDLLNRYKFQFLQLLESHTGAIKPPSVWHTKLKDGQELAEIPFDRMTLQMFGDSVHFSPMHKKVRMAIYNIAVKNKWTHATTKDYVIHCVVQYRDPALENLVKELYRG